jgi:hypothetical protein
MKSAQVCNHSGEWYYRPFSRTSAGVRVGSEIVLKIPDSASALEKGQTAVLALQHSLDDVPHPDRWIDPCEDALLRAAGVTRWATFMKGTQSLAIELEGSSMKLVPERNLGAKGGFERLENKSTEIEYPADLASIGDALTQAFKCCE